MYYKSNNYTKYMENYALNLEKETFGKDNEPITIDISTQDGLFSLTATELLNAISFYRNTLKEEEEDKKLRIQIELIQNELKLEKRDIDGKYYKNFFRK